MDRETAEKAYRAALDEAAKQLSYRDHSAAGLREKLLRKAHSEDAADYALAWLCARGMLDDNRYAAALAESYARRGYGLMRIKQEMQRRGISREDADAALADHAADPDVVISLLEKKRKGSDDPKDIQRAVAFLQRRGFLWEDIRRALQQIK